MIRLKNIHKKYDSFYLRDVSFSAEKGVYLVILGPSGAGKTVILELVAGLITPDRGSVSGVDMHRVGFIYQDYMLFPHLNVFDNIAYGLKLRKCSKEEIKSKVETIAESFKIRHLLSRDVENLSGGEKQRVAIARALVIQPEVVLLDEPTAALDVYKRRNIQKMLRELHHATGATFIHVTHNYEEALAVAERIVVINEGSVLQQGRTEDIFHKPANKFVADFVGYKNVYAGGIKNNLFTTGNIEIYVIYKDTDYAYIAVKSNDITLSRSKIDSSARNSFCGRVVSIKKNVSIVELTVDIGIELQAEITHKSLEELKIREGDQLWLTFKASSVMVFEH